MVNASSLPRASTLIVLSLGLTACSDPAPVLPVDAGIDAPRIDVPAVDAGAPDVPSIDRPADDVPAVTTDDGTQAVAINFAGRVGSQEFRCGQRYTLGTPAVQADVADFRFYVHDVRLVRADGTEVPVALATNTFQYGGVALIDFENRTGECDQGDAETNTVVQGRVPIGSYAGLRFRLGIPFAMNHTDLTAQPSPLNRSTLFWSWNSGHLFFASTTRSPSQRPITVDGGMGASDAAATGDLGLMMVMNDHFTHVGSTGCMGNPSAGTPVTTCTRPNRAEINLAAFDAGRQRVVADLAAVKEGVDITSNPGCHSFSASCTAMFSHLGLDWMTGAPTPATQTVFRVE